VIRTLLAASLPTLGAPVSHAQEAPVFRAEVGLVQIEVRATDGDGQPVTDLRREDFVLEEGGQQQQIEAFQFVARCRSSPRSSRSYRRR